MLSVSVISFAPLSVGVLLRHLPAVVLCAILAGVSAQPIFAATATTTALTVSPTALAPGKPAKLVATVTDASNKSISPGTVTFYDGTRLLGTAQLVSHPGGGFAEGTATLNIASFNAGSNSITAVFAGTESYLGSTSSAQTVTVQPLQTTTALAVSGTSGSYDLTGRVKSFGTALPTGSIDFFNDMSHASLGSLSLSGANVTSGFVASSVLTGPAELRGLVVGDFNGDGLLDTAISSNFADVAVFLGNGDGTFASPIYAPGTDAPLVISPVAAYVGDFNNDGIPDLMDIVFTGDQPDLTLPVLFLGNGDGTFQTGLELTLDKNLNGCIQDSFEGVVSDFDHDGNLDFAMAGVQILGSGDANNAICLIRGNGDGTFKTPQVLSPSTQLGFNSFAAGDFNSDGIPDLILSTDTLTQTVEQVLISNGDGTFQPAINYSLGAGASSYYSPNFALGDLNGDGNLDLAVVNASTSSVTVALGKGDGTFGPTATYPIGGSLGQPVILDLNGDGKPDVAVAYYDELQATSIPVLLGNGDGTFQPVVNYPVNGQSTGLLAQGDFNGDGLPDLFTSDIDLSSAEVLLHQNTSSVTLSGVNLPDPGTNSVFAQYTGDSNYAPSTSCDISPGVKPELPALTKIYSDHITSTTASIGWTSNFPTNGYVSYGTTSALGQGSPFEHNATTFHFVDLAGLAPGTTYYYTVTSIAYFSGCDHWTTTSHVNSFTTAAP